jgi:acyl-CoA hydrolase
VVTTNPRRPEPAESEIEAQVVSILESVEKLERFIDDAGFVPATQQHRGQVILALFSKALTVSRAICALVRAGFGEEAFGMGRTLIDIYLVVRYIANKDTENRAERFVMFFAKDQEGWQKVIPKYYPTVAVPNTTERKEILDIAKNYRNPYDWSGEPEKTKSLAKEPDTYEFDSTGNGITAEFDYDIMFKYTSHFVHSTVCALEDHIAERGDTFKIRTRWSPRRKARLALFNVLAMISKTSVCGFRALGYDQPEEILQEMNVKMQAH